MSIPPLPLCDFKSPSKTATHHSIAMRKSEQGWTGIAFGRVRMRQFQKIGKVIGSINNARYPDVNTAPGVHL